MKKSKIFLLFIICMMFTQNVYAATFQCRAFGNDVYIEKQLAHIVHYIILILHIFVPIILVVLGSIDLIKGIVSQKEDEIKKGQQVFIKRVIAGALVFFVVALVKIVVSLGANSNSNSIFECVNKFIKGTA